MDMPTLTPGHKKLEKFSGNWLGEEKMYPSKWDPKGGVATGKMITRLDLGGFASISDYVQERGGKVTFTGHSVTTFDPKTGLYTMHWFDCVGSEPEMFTGKFEGETIVLGHGGPGMHARMTYDFSHSPEMRSKMEMSKDGREWMTLFDGRYTRS
jgi:uncharacterized protein YodC (DUF2158 family)